MRRTVWLEVLAASYALRRACRLMARFIALIYNWWSLFVRLAEPGKHLEPITSRRLLLSAIAERTRHARQTTLRVASSHAKAGCVARREGLRKLDRVESRERQARVTDRNERAWMTRRLSDEPATPDLNSLCTHATSNAGMLSLKLVRRRSSPLVPEELVAPTRIKKKRLL